MLESLIELLSSLIEVIPKIKKSQKRRIGKALAKIYLGLNDIVWVGKEILLILEHARLEYRLHKEAFRSEYYLDKLSRLLHKQEKRIKKIRTDIEESNIETILKIHLPELKDLQVLLERKNDRIAVLTGQLRFQKLKSRKFESIDFLDLYNLKMSWQSELKLVLPTEASINKSHNDLSQIEDLNDKLRKFLVKEFTIDEIT